MKLLPALAALPFVVGCAADHARPASGTAPTGAPVGGTLVEATGGHDDQAPGVSIVVTDYHVIPDSPVVLAPPYHRSGAVATFSYDNATDGDVTTDQLITIQSPAEDGGWTDRYQLAISPARDGTTVWAPVEKPDPGDAVEATIRPRGVAGPPTLTYSLPLLTPGVYRVRTDLYDGEVDEAIGELRVPDDAGFVPGSPVLEPPTDRDPPAFLAFSAAENPAGNVSAMVVNRAGDVVSTSTEATLQRWDDVTWQPVAQLRPSVIAGAGPLGQAIPATHAPLDSAIHVPVRDFQLFPKSAIVMEGFSLPALNAGRYRITQAATVGDVRFELAGRFQKLGDDPAPAPRPVPTYTLVDVTEPISGIGSPDAVIVASHAGDPRPIPADDIARRYPIGTGTLTLYYGRYTCCRGTIGEIIDRPLWLVVADTDALDTCMLRERPSADQPTCPQRVVVPLDPLTAEPIGSITVTNR